MLRIAYTKPVIRPATGIAAEVVRIGKILSDASGVKISARRSGHNVTVTSFFVPNTSTAAALDQPTDRKQGSSRFGRVLGVCLGMRTGTCRLLTSNLAAVALFAATVARAQEAAPQQPRPTFKSAVDLVS